jgi:indoleamine 2,3-dioxygenase
MEPRPHSDSSPAIPPVRGFLPAEDPLPRLSGCSFDPWEETARSLPKLLLGDHLRTALAELPPFPCDLLDGDRELERAMVILSFLGHAYVWGEDPPAERLPARLAVPWHAVAHRLGRPPVLSYASYALHNWRRLDPAGPVALGNIALVQNFYGGLDEEWFVLVHVDIEARASTAIAALEPAIRGAERGDAQEVRGGLEEVARGLEAIVETLERMPEKCDPYIYFHRVRPYIHGWKDHPALPTGVVYEGVAEYDERPQCFRGETGAQSSIIPALDAFLGITHRDDPLSAFLQEMRDYMPPAHRAFIAHLESISRVREVVSRCGAESPELRHLYNRCVRLVHQFRTTHVKYAARYIQEQSQTNAANPAGIGTGGTPFMRYLQKHRHETEEHLL